MNTSIVLYHQSCPDGLCSAWAAWKKLGDTADYLPANYHKPVPDDANFAGRDVYLVDFSYPLATLERLKTIAKSITVLDHHQTAFEALKGTPFAQHIRQDWSGAHITWDFFHGLGAGRVRSFVASNDPRDVVAKQDLAPDVLALAADADELPVIVRYVEDNDIWLHKLPHWEAVKVVGEMLDLHAKDAIQTWDAFAEKMDTPSGLAEVQERGRAIVEYRNIQIQRAAYEPAFTFLDGHKVPCVNAPNWQSEIGDILDKKHPFAVMWRMTKDGNFAYSLRSDKETGIDVAAIAQKFGGGGHRNSAGFSSNAPPMIVRK